MRASFLRSIALIAVFGESMGAQSSGPAFGTPGTLNGIAVIPSSVTVYVPTTISVSGFGQCGQVRIIFGDGKDTILSPVNFPAQVAHAYAKAGTYVVAARPGTTCNATPAVSTTVKVEGSSVDILCGLLGCDNARAACTKPQINIVTFSTPLEPTEELVVHGCGFGDPQPRGGQSLLMKGAFPAVGSSISLQILNWTNTAVTAKVPALTGVRDQIAHLQIEREPNSSNQFPVSFRATRTFRYLAATESMVKLTCGSSAQFNSCGMPYTLSAVHANPGGTTVTGTDMIGITLANGWVIEKHAVQSHYPFGWAALEASAYAMTMDGTSMPIVVDASALVRGAPSGTLRIGWTLGPGSYSGIRADVLAKGPVGVPLK